MPCLTVCVRIGPPGLLTVGLRYPLLCLVYCPTYSVCLVWLSRPVRVGNECGPPELSTPFWPYQSLPYFPHPRHDALADLVWSGPGLPILTMPPIWLCPYCVRPLPNITTATKGLHIDVSVVAGIGHQGTGWPGWHRVIRVDNGGAQWRTLKESQNGGTQWWSASERKNLFHQAGRLVNLHPWW